MGKFKKKLSLKDKFLCGFKRKRSFRKKLPVYIQCEVRNVLLPTLHRCKVVKN